MTVGDIKNFSDNKRDDLEVYVESRSNADIEITHATVSLHKDEFCIKLVIDKN